MTDDLESKSTEVNEPGATTEVAGAGSPLYANAFFVWVNQAGTGLAGFVFWALAARLYDADEVGLGSAAFAVLTLLSMVSTLGLGLGLIRFYPEAKDDGPRLANVVFTGSAAAALLTSAVFIVGLPVWAPDLDFLRDQPLYALAFIAFVVAGTLNLVQTQAFMAIRKGKYILAQVVAVQVSRLALPAVLVAFFGAFGILAASGFARGLGAVIGFALMAKGLPGYRPRWTVDPTALFRLLPFALANYVANFLIIAPSLLLPVMVVSILGAEQGAYFYIAWFIGFLPLSFSTALGTSLFAEGSHDPQSLQPLLRKAMAGGLAIAAVAAAVLLIVANGLLHAFGGDYSDEGATLLRIMAVAALPAAIVNVYVGSLRVLKRSRELIGITSVMAVITVALSAVLLRSMDLEGAGVAHASAQLFGVTIVLGRMLATAEGRMSERIRGLLAGFAGRV